MINTPQILDTVRNREGAVSFGFAAGWTLKRKLFSYMFLLVCLLCIFLVTALFLSGQFSSTQEDTFDALDMQMKVFEKDIVNHFDTLAAAGIGLSKTMTGVLEDYLSRNEMEFSNLTDNAEAISELQSILLGQLLQSLYQENCSGIYFVLDTTINSSLENADCSRTGMYLQTNGYKTSYNPVSLLYGNAEISRANDITPHRQWQLEFNTSEFPDYDTIRSEAILPLAKSYRYTELYTIPGTEMRIMLLCVPMLSADGTFYGICGFEISESYFMSFYAQPAKVDYLTYVFTPAAAAASGIDTDKSLSCGVSDGYYRAPQGILTLEKEGGNGMYAFSGDDIAYLGIMQNVTLSPNNPDYTLSVMMRKSDYDLDLRMEYTKNISMWILILIAAVSCCYYFSRKFLAPILYSLEQLKSDELTAIPYDIPEITDLFEFLSKKDSEHEEALTTLEQEKQDVQKEKDSLLQEKDSLLQEYEKIQQEYEKSQSEAGKTQTEFEKAQEELARLAYSRQAEIDPDAYAQFLEGIELLTRTERRIFDYYLDGLGIKEIAETLQVKESTIYSHNKNIYSKLGINSLKQLLRYAALMHQQEKEAAGLA